MLRRGYGDLGRGRQIRRRTRGGRSRRPRRVRAFRDYGWITVPTYLRRMEFVIITASVVNHKNPLSSFDRLPENHDRHSRRFDV